MERVGIIANPRAAGLASVLKELVQWLTTRGIDVMLDDAVASLGVNASLFSIETIPTKVELIIVLGGDGTLLRAARLPGIYQVPILGVNLGDLGFLTEIPVSDLFPVLEQIFKHEFVVDERLMLYTRIKREGEIVSSHHNLNDIVINKGVMARIIKLDTFINGQYVNTFLADGLIISTPTGSTAYSMSAGGPILYPSTKGLIITPICPHTLTNRPIVIPDNFQIEVRLKSENEDVYITYDGQQYYPLRYDDSVELCKSEHSIRLIQPRQKNYYQVLRSKLNWGVR
jgi:NAD+ kinase